MKINTRMPGPLKPFYRQELLLAKKALAGNQYSLSWQHLERAHILGQPYPLAHTAVHWKMLQFGIRIKNTKEVIGQIPRLIFGGIKSFVGKIPVGNTGGANVPPLQPMQIPEDLQAIINRTQTY